MGFGTRDYGYEYFCGANVVVEIESMPILECAGISFNINESKRPIYGYSSRFFDAVAAGQVLATGSLLINYVHHNYLFKAIEIGLNRNTSPALPTLDKQSSELRDALTNPDQTEAMLQEWLNDPDNSDLVPLALKDKYYNNYKIGYSDEIALNAHDSYGGLDIKISFGNRAPENLFSGKTGFQLTDVHFTGRGVPVSISEDVIVEEYPFFARNVIQRSVPYRALYQPTVVNGQVVNEVVIQKET